MSCREPKVYARHVLDNGDPFNQAELAKGKVLVAIYVSGNCEPDLFWAARDKHWRSFARDVREGFEFADDVVFALSWDSKGKDLIDFDNPAATFAHNVVPDRNGVVEIYLHRRRTSSNNSKQAIAVPFIGSTANSKAFPAMTSMAAHKKEDRGLAKLITWKNDRKGETQCSPVIKALRRRLTGILDPGTLSKRGTASDNAHEHQDDLTGHSMQDDQDSSESSLSKIFGPKVEDQDSMIYHEVHTLPKVSPPAASVVPTEPAAEVVQGPQPSTNSNYVAGHTRVADKRVSAATVKTSLSGLKIGEKCTPLLSDAYSSGATSAKLFEHHADNQEIERDYFRNAHTCGLSANEILLADQGVTPNEDYKRHSRRVCQGDHENIRQTAANDFRVEERCHTQAGQDQDKSSPENGVKRTSDFTDGRFNELKPILSDSDAHPSALRDVQDEEYARRKALEHRRIANPQPFFHTRTQSSEAAYEFHPQTEFYGCLQPHPTTAVPQVHLMHSCHSPQNPVQTTMPQDPYPLSLQNHVPAHSPRDLMLQEAFIQVGKAFGQVGLAFAAWQHHQQEDNQDLKNLLFSIKANVDKRFRKLRSLIRDVIEVARRKRYYSLEELQHLQGKFDDSFQTRLEYISSQQELNSLASYDSLHLHLQKMEAILGEAFVKETETSTRLDKIDELLGEISSNADNLQAMVSLLAAGEQIPCPRLVLFELADKDTSVSFFEFVRHAHQHRYNVYFYCERSFQAVNRGNPMILYLDRSWVKHVTLIMETTIRIASTSLLGCQLNLSVTDCMSLNVDVNGCNLRDAVTAFAGEVDVSQVDVDIATELVTELDGPTYERFSQEATKPENQKFWRSSMTPAFEGDKRRRFIWVANEVKT